MNKEQKKYADEYLKDNPQIPELYLNPDGEWFTDHDYAINSLKKDKDGKTIGEIETVKRPKVSAKKDVVNPEAGKDQTDQTIESGSGQTNGADPEKDQNENVSGTETNK